MFLPSSCRQAWETGVPAGVGTELFEEEEGRDNEGGREGEIMNSDALVPKIEPVVELIEPVIVLELDSIIAGLYRALNAKTTGEK